WGLLGQTVVATGELTAYVDQHDCWTYIELTGDYFLEGSYTYYRNWAYIDAWGAGHPFYVDSRTAWGSCNGVPYSSFEVNATAADGSGYTIQTQDMGYEKAWITTPSGTAMYPPVNSSDSVASITDRNGNIISKGSGGFSDTLSTTTAALAIS